MNRGPVHILPWILATLLLAGATVLAGPQQPQSKQTPRDEALAAVQSRIAKAPVLRGVFEQEKQVRGFTHALKSSGRFLIVRDRGVVWSTLEPFPSELVLTADRILSRQPGGDTRMEMDARGEPALSAVNAMLLALLRGDVQALSAHFRIEADTVADAGWRLRLSPKPGALERAFRTIVLEGDRYVRRVEMEAPGGDRTVIVFSQSSETPAQLGADEAARFDR